MATAAITAEREHYLNKEYGIRSWLLTVDHKRIALLYLISITFFFFIGGFFALLIRLELLTPMGDLVQSDTYNKLFTMHGVAMIFFFLIPSIPATWGNFFLPIMIGARDLAFPRLNLLSWYLLVIGGLFSLFAMLAGVRRRLQRPEVAVSLAPADRLASAVRRDRVFFRWCGATRQASTTSACACSARPRTPPTSPRKRSSSCTAI